MSAARRRSVDAKPIGRPVPTQLCSHSWIASTVWPGAWPAVEPRSCRAGLDVCWSHGRRYRAR